MVECVRTSHVPPESQQRAGAYSAPGQARPPLAQQPEQPRKHQHVGYRHHDERPVPPPVPGRQDSHAYPREERGKLGERQRLKTHLPPHNGVMLNAQPAEHVAYGIARRDPGHFLSVENPPEDRRQQGDKNGERRSKQGIDPEKRAYLLVRNLLLLNSGHRKAHILEHPDERNDGRHHRYEAIVGRRQQPRQRHVGENTGNKDPCLNAQRQSAAASGPPAEIGSQMRDVELAAGHIHSGRFLGASPLAFDCENGFFLLLIDASLHVGPSKLLCRISQGMKKVIPTLLAA